MSVNWNNSLPYDLPTDHVAWNDIKFGVAKAIKTKKLSTDLLRIFLLSFYFLTNLYTGFSMELLHYIKLKLPIPIDDRITLLKVYYKLATQPGMQPSFIDTFSAVFRNLAKKESELKNCGLILEWLPLMEMTDSAFYKKSRDRVLPGTQAVYNSALGIVSPARDYFPDCATAEILERFLPKINVHNPQNSHVYITLMCMLLPIKVPPPMPSSLVGAPGFYWIPTMFSIWRMLANWTACDIIFLDLFSRLAQVYAYK